MKKFLLSLALVAMTLSFTACGDDDEPNQDNASNYSYLTDDCINTTITIAQNSVNYVGTANYYISTTPSNDGYSISITASGIKFDSRMPVQVSFKMDDIHAKASSGKPLVFEASDVKIYNTADGQEITNYHIDHVKGVIVNSTFVIEYVINNTWKVRACNNQLFTKVTNNNYNESELFYEYQINPLSMKAEVFIYNVQFQVGGASSPVLRKISIPDLDVTATTTGLELTGNNIVPNYYSGNSLEQITPYPELVVTNFHSTLNLSNGDHSIFFNCHDGEHSVSNKLYLWE